MNYSSVEVCHLLNRANLEILERVSVILKERVTPCLLKRMITFKEKINSSPVINSTHTFLLWGDFLGNLEVPKLILGKATGEFPEQAGKWLKAALFTYLITMSSWKLVLPSTALCFWSISVLLRWILRRNVVSLSSNLKSLQQTRKDWVKQLIKFVLIFLSSKSITSTLSVCVCVCVCIKAHTHAFPHSIINVNRQRRWRV